MSAFIVGHDHINALLDHAVRHQVSYYVPSRRERVTIMNNNATEIGAILLDQNERSVRHRYPGIAPSELPGTIGENAASFRWRPRVPLQPVQIMKACHCLDYQCCETKDWERTIAFLIVQAILNDASRRVPGYDGAKWEIIGHTKAAA